MACDIHVYAEVRVGGKWRIVAADLRRCDFDPPVVRKLPTTECPLNWSNFSLFAFLAGVRNYSAIPIVFPPRGMPPDASPPVQEEFALWRDEAHTPSWLALHELLDFDYDQTIEDRRLNGSTLEPGQGTQTTVRDYLGKDFFQSLVRLRQLGSPDNLRIVFWFDN